MMRKSVDYESIIHRPDFAANWANSQIRIHLPPNCLQKGEPKTNVMHLNMKWWLSHLDRRNSELLKRDAQQHFATTNKDGETEGKGDGDGGRVVFASNNWAVPTVPTVPIVTLQIRRWKRPQIRCQMWFSRKALGRCAKTVLNVHDNLRLINS